MKKKKLKNKLQTMYALSLLLGLYKGQQGWSNNHFRAAFMTETHKCIYKMFVPILWFMNHRVDITEPSSETHSLTHYKDH